MIATKKSSQVSRWAVGAIKQIKHSHKLICSHRDSSPECAFRVSMAELTMKIDAVQATYSRPANPSDAMLV
jgi:hypothetical protein